MANFCNNTVLNRERFAEKTVHRYLHTEIALQSDRCLKILPGNSKNELIPVADAVKILFFESDRPGENLYPCVVLFSQLM